VCVQLLKTAINMRSDFTQAYMNRGDILMRLNRSARHVVKIYFLLILLIIIWYFSIS